jgi:hypothetical protein
VQQNLGIDRNCNQQPGIVKSTKISKTTLELSKRHTLHYVRVTWREPETHQEILHTGFVLGALQGS